MEIPRYWRRNKQRYALAGAVCPTCQTAMFPPRPVCPQCAENARQQAQYVALQSSAVPAFAKASAELVTR